jgi:hypothetical protein
MMERKLEEKKKEKTQKEKCWGKEKKKTTKTD